MDDEECSLSSQLEGFDAMPLELALERAAAHASVRTDGAATEAQLVALEGALGTTLPPEYRAFLLRFGGLSVEGSEEYPLGTLRVCGLGDIVANRARFREECDVWANEEGWLENRVPVAGEVTPGDEGRGPLAAPYDRLGVGRAEAGPLFGDRHDELRIAYRLMVPLFVHGEDLHQGVLCGGPGGRLFQVFIKSREVEPARRTFGEELKQAIGEVLVDGARRPS